MENVFELKGKRVVQRTFNTIEETVKFIKNTPVNEIFKIRALSSEKYDLDFFESNTFPEALNSFEFGYNKHFAQIKNSIIKAKKIIQKDIKNKMGKYSNQVVGFIPIVPNAIMGHPISMINQNIVKKNVPTTRIYIQTSNAGYQSINPIVNYRSVIFTLIDLMEQKNIRCEVYASRIVESDDEIYVNNVKIKDFYQPFNLYKMQFPTISPDMLRRIGFKLLEIEPLIKDSDWRFGYGHAIEHSDDIDIELSEDRTMLSKDLQLLLKADKNDIYFPSIDKMRINGSTSIEEIIEEIMKKTNIKQYIKIGGQT